MPSPSNDNLSLQPYFPAEVPALELDFPEIHIGVAEYREGPTGCTIFYFPDGPYSTAIDARGGSYGITYGISGGYSRVSAICLAGGSAYGLEAATGAAAELFAMRDYSVEWGKIAVVAGAIIFDYGRRANAIYPDKALARAAVRAARPGRFPLGRHGAGSSATVGKAYNLAHGEYSGQGAAFRLAGPTRIAVFTVVNARGAIVDRRGEVVRGHLDPALGTRYDIAAGVERRLSEDERQEAPPGNTTLTVLVTNQRLDPTALGQLGRQVHASMARGIQPFNTESDGDILFAVTTGQVDNPALDNMGLAVLASELAWDAVLCCFEDN